MNTMEGDLIIISVTAIISLLVPIRVTVVIVIPAPRLALLNGTTAHHGHLSGQAVLFRFRDFVFSALGALAQCWDILTLQLWIAMRIVNPV